MKAEQVDRALHQKFFSEQQRVVFWHDSNSEFADYVAGGLTGDLKAVKVLEVATTGGLSAKLRLEREDIVGKYLIYTTGDVPPPDQDWLLDIRLYSAEFHADVASIWLQELGLTDLYLREHLAARALFLGNQERRKKLKRLLSDSDDEAALDLEMMAVLTGSAVANPFAVLRALCHGHLENGRFALNEPPRVIATFEKMGLADRFWEVMRQEFGYHEPGNPTVAGLLRRLFVSELFRESGGVRIDALAHFELPAAGRQNAVVCLSEWRDSSGKASSYDATAEALENELKVSDHLGGLELAAIKNIFTFWAAEKRVVSGLKGSVLSKSSPIDLDAITAIATARKASHWHVGPGRDRPERRAIADGYDAIVAAAELFTLRAAHHHGFSFEDARALLCAYRDELYRFDSLYRQFCTRARAAQDLGWDLLKTLTEEVERVYDQGFLQPLGLEWGRLLDAGFLGSWSVEGLPAQQRFFANTIRPHLDQSPRRRAYVIISDAFRYEAAHELTCALNGRYRMNAALTSMLGVLPSYTALGMASLLPHQTLAYSEKGDVLLDGKPVAGTDARGKQLATVGGMACQAKDLRVMKQDDARAFTEGKRVVYIYHNVIDDRLDGDNKETGSLDAVSDCIDELVGLVQFCVNKLNAAKVWVTADHGFLFQQESPDQTDKSQLVHKPEQAVKINKRYVISRNLGPTPEAHHGSIKATAGAEGDMEFWLPRGTNRFYFTGGARFVHGGAMPQEIVLPVVTVSQLRGKQKTGSRSEKVSVQVLGTKHKITATTYRFEFIQTEAVSERRNPITLKAAVYDGVTAVTAVETITFDSTSESIEERKKSIRLKLRTGTYDKNKPYRLVLRDVDSDAEVQSVQVVIDRSFDDDFR